MLCLLNSVAVYFAFNRQLFDGQSTVCSPGVLQVVTFSDVENTSVEGC